MTSFGHRRGGAQGGSGGLLAVEDLHVRFRTPTRVVEAVRGVSFHVGRERVGIVGESGSGKTMTGRSILRLIRPPGEVTAKRLEFYGIDLLRLSERRMRAIRGERIAMVMQDPKYSLNPVMKIGKQLTEVLKVHHGGSGREARRRAIEMLEAVHIRDPQRVMRAYPHELSGGMGQRVMVAMMLIPDPDLLIADEPTSALDVTVQLEVLRIMDDLVRSRGMGLIFISHDLDLVATFCDRVLVMYAGQIVEEIEARNLAAAKHPYTQGLINCLPKIGARRDVLPTLTRESAWSDAHDPLPEAPA
jgi:peptide/nickel transport system ATP-binding protein